MEENLTRFVENGEGYLELKPVMSDVVDISIDLCPKEGTKFTATAPVFKWEVANPTYNSS